MTAPAGVVEHDREAWCAGPAAAEYAIRRKTCARQHVYRRAKEEYNPVS
jgi:hypothetical protein